jgi:uncharacterized protein YdeI (YjbR/CyaY-like superfamily)
MKKHATVDQFLTATTEWRAELKELRALLLSTGLEETIKTSGIRVGVVRFFRD